jgi:copper resistance protein B
MSRHDYRSPRAVARRLWFALALPLSALAQGSEPATPLLVHAVHAVEAAPPGHGVEAGGTREADHAGDAARDRVPGMHAPDRQALAMLRVDQLETTRCGDARGSAWQVQGWYGNDEDKLWWGSEGERHESRLGDARVEVAWSHAVAPFWDSRLGLRQDLGDGPRRRWAAFGIAGLAPYWFELEATAYLGEGGRVAARLHAAYELRFSQRLILQPEAELNLYGRDDPAAGSGRGLSDSRLGLRLRYEIRREFAPYVGVAWTHRYGAGAAHARHVGQPVAQRQFVAGLRFWF